MALERSTFGWGSAVYPITSATANSSLQDIDPSLYYALDYFAAVLQTSLGARWAVECAAANRPDLASSVVASKVPFDPTQFLTETQFSLPILAVFRESATNDERTVIWA